MDDLQHSVCTVIGEDLPMWEREREREREREELGKNLWMNTKVYGPMSYSSTGPSSSQNNGLEGEVMRTRPDGELFLVMILNWNYFSFFRRHIIIFFPVERQMRCIKVHLTWYFWDYWKKILILNLMLECMMWLVWKERNNCTFEESVRPIE